MILQLGSRPSVLVDPYALIGAMEQLADYPARQITRSVDDLKLFSNSVDPLSESLISLSNSFQPSVSSPFPQPGQFKRRYAAQSSHPLSTLRAFGGRRRAPTRRRCFQCRMTGHFVRNCPDLNGR